MRRVDSAALVAALLIYYILHCGADNRIIYDGIGFFALAMGAKMIIAPFNLLLRRIGTWLAPLKPL